MIKQNYSETHLFSRPFFSGRAAEKGEKGQFIQFWRSKSERIRTFQGSEFDQTVRTRIWVQKDPKANFK